MPKENKFDMVKIKDLSHFNVADYVTDQETLQAFLNALLEDVDGAAILASSLGDICRKLGMTDIASRTGITREALYRALRNDPASQPSFNAIFKVITALGFKLQVVPITTSQSKE